MADFGEVRSLLHDAEPSKEAFEQLLGLFRQAPDSGEAERVWLPYALEHLEAWPDAERAVTFAGESSLEQGELSWLPLARALTLGYQPWSGARLEELVTSQAFAGVRDFVFEASNAHGTILDWLAGSPHAQGLEALELREVKGGVEALAGSSLMLRRLSLNLSAVGDAGLEALASSPMIETLQELSLSACGIEGDGVRALARATAPALRVLDLSYNPLGEGAAAALARGANRPLESLSLYSCEVEDDGLVALAESGALSGCRKLDTSYSSVGDDGVLALVRSGAPETMRRLELMHGCVGPRGARAMASASWPALSRLKLEGNPLGAQGVMEIMRGPGMNALVELDMDECVLDELTLGDDSVEVEFPRDRSRAGEIANLHLAASGLDARATLALAQTNRLAGAANIAIYGNPMGAEGARALAASPHLEGVVGLDLEDCLIGDEGFASLFSGDGSSRFPALQTLNLGGNGLTDASAWVLAGLGAMRLSVLYLDRNLFGAPWLEELLAVAPEGLRELMLEGTPFGDAGLEVFGRSRRLDALRFLNVNDVGAGPYGMRALLAGPVMDGLTHVSAKRNGCDGDAMLALAGSPHAASLDSLWLGYHEWEDAVWRALATSPNLRSLGSLYASRSLDLRGILADDVREGVTLNPWALERLNDSGDLDE